MARGDVIKISSQSKAKAIGNYKSPKEMNPVNGNKNKR